ncbi:hypothetical protein AMATHDRAFT_147095 [Amanita thiersii Skay4041]|uniref:Hemimethylated DNA-binding domain-containing protein n=1 Tax=Amanita thiersii Skay4041 TaxID=703135 RepID=A0A2A9NFA9_9AGAR|nr:hypothetical protein AMATHDRAFT_147095 [Amanita thiersii Skay4041]
MPPQLPFDVLVHIFNAVTPSRLDDTGAKTLVSCLQVNHLFRDACLNPSLWEKHYLCRYTRSVPHLELKRREAYGRNWWALYNERRSIDQVAVSCLEVMVLNRTARYEQAATLTRVSLDIWDVLDIESRCAVPSIFGDSSDDATPRPHALTRKHWAKAMADAITRATAIDVWSTVIQDNSEEEESQRAIHDEYRFEYAISALSCFFGRPLTETTARLDELANECRAFLLAEGTTLNPLSPAYDLRQLCRGICQFMQMHGFGIAEHGHFRRMLNHFPHSYISTNKRTLPISLVHIFVAVSRRIGVRASPVDFPNIVIVHVAAVKQGEEDLFINPSTPDVINCVMEIPDDIEPLVSRLLVVPEPITALLVPCEARPMLLRASRNILAAFQEDVTLEYDDGHPAMLAAITIQLLLQVEPRFLIGLMAAIDIRPLDCVTLFLNKLSRFLSPGHRSLLERICDSILTSEADLAAFRGCRMDGMNVKYFVGMIFKHVRFDYLGCIIGWDFTCKASEDWMRRMKIDELDRGRNQPFYLIYADDGSQRYVAEENITCINPSINDVQGLFSVIPILPRYFEDAELNGTENGWMRGRFLLSPDSLTAYPDDDEVGAIWVRDGILPY